MQPESSGCNEVKYNLNVDTIEAIFKTYPAGNFSCILSLFFTFFFLSLFSIWTRDITYISFVREMWFDVERSTVIAVCLMSKFNTNLILIILWWL